MARDMSRVQEMYSRYKELCIKYKETIQVPSDICDSTWEKHYLHLVCKSGVEAFKKLKGLNGK